MWSFSKRCATVLTIILAIWVLGFGFVGVYAQSPGAETQNKIAYLTIDDGPSRSLTPKNLDTLKRYGVKATYFVLPRNGMDDLYQRIVAEGHAIGNHSYSHDYDYLYSSTLNFEKDVIKAGSFIFEKTGLTPTVFRFPGGSMGRSASVIKARADILAGLGYKYFDWDVSTADTAPNLKKYGDEEHIAELLADNVVKNTRNRNSLIILMHDTSIYSSRALPKIIEGLQKQGYTFGVLTNDAAGQWQYELNENDDAVITGYVGNSTVVAVPSMLAGHTVVSIGSGAFAHDPITSISIPDSVASMDSGAFWECSTLRAISIAEGNTEYRSVDGVVFDKTGALLKQYPPGKSGSYAVPAGVTTIGAGAFRGSSGLTQIIFSDSVSRIDTAAFALCAGLIDVKLASGLLNVSNMAFQSCRSLQSIVMPESLEAVGDMAFEGCASLTDIYFLGDMPDFGDEVFQDTAEGFSAYYFESRMESWAAYSAYAHQPFSDMPYFNDVSSGAWYYEAVNFVAARGITGGTGNGRYSPHAKLTRGETMVLIMRAFGVAPDENPTDNFADAGGACSGYLGAAKRLGISAGVGGNLFMPDKEITRQEMFALLYNALKATEWLSQGDSGRLHDFADAAKFESWAIDVMAQSVATGGSEDAPIPSGAITRAEIALILYNLLSK